MKKKILAVDNNPVILRLLENLFSRENHDIMLANSGLEALELLNTFSPDVMFVDLIMPNISGQQFCKVVRKMPHLNDTVIVILSAIAAESQVNYQDFGADYCIAKGPFQEISRHLLAMLNKGRPLPGEEISNSILGFDKIYEREVTKELLFSKKHLEIILQNMSEGILELSQSRKIIYANKATISMIGKSEEELLTKDFLDIFQEQDRELINTQIHQAQNEFIVKDIETPVLIEERYVVVNILPIKNNDHRCFTIILNDVTADIQKEEAQKKLEHQAKLAHTSRLTALGEMSTGIAHELNQPLSVIGLGIHFFKRFFSKNTPDESVMQTIDKMEQHINKASTIINNMRSFARKSGDKLSDIDIKKPVEIALSFFEEQFRLHQIEFIKNFTDDLPKVQGENQKIEQVVINLLSNARYAVDKKSDTAGDGYKKKITVSLATSENQNQVFLEVKDNGSGMTRKEQKHCIEPFFTTKEVGQGTGLGLSIIYNIVTEIGGEIELESEEGSGSTFRVIFPRVKK